MKVFVGLIIVTFFALNTGSAQIRPLLPKFYLPYDQSSVDETKDDKKDEENKKQTLLKFHDKVSYSVSVGTSYSSFSSNISLMSSYVAPSINYQANDKLLINVTGVIMQNNFNGLENLSSYSPVGYNSNAANYGISGSFLYKLSDKWSITGDGAYFQNQSVMNNYTNQLYNTDYKSVSLGVNYKISEKVQFNAQFNYSNGFNPAYNSYSPFYNSSLNNRSQFGIWDY